MPTPTVGKRRNQKTPQASHFRISSRSMTWSFWRRASSFTDSPRLRLRLARPRSQTRLACGFGSHGHVHRLASPRSEEHTSELQSRLHLVCRLLLEKKKKIKTKTQHME